VGVIYILTDSTLHISCHPGPGDVYVGPAFAAPTDRSLETSANVDVLSSRPREKK
jgi:hypothetical protein